jgi:hypothetical protein
LDPALSDSAMAVGTVIDWDALMPFITRYARDLADACIPSPPHRGERP